MKPYRTEKIHYSKPASNKHEIRALITAPNSKPFYDAVLSLLTTDYQPVSNFGSAALKELKKIPCEAGFDCNADVIHILSGLVQAGLAKSKQTVFHEGEFERVAGSRVEYSLL